ncbi:MAG TPA: MFS transporter [Alphaproteobacteria bacterium]|nr:MFS transporter [Alphaproteobacteria bacterium]
MLNDEIATSAVPRGGARGTLVAMCLGLLVAQLDTSVVNLALAPIARDLGAGVGQLQWIVDAYNLVYGGLLLTGGTLGDLYGRKRIFLVGTALFCAGSVLCALAADATTLIAARIVTGLGAALELPVTLAILTVAFPDPRERARAIGTWAGINGLAFVIGPTLGGLLVDHAGWRSVFWLVVPFALASLAVAWRAVTESTGAAGRRLDVPGQLLMVTGLTALTLAAIEGRGWGWGSGATIGCVLLGFGAAASFVAYERRVTGGLVPPAFFRKRPFAGALAVIAAMTFGMYGLLFLSPLYLQELRGASPLAAGLELLPMSAVFAVVSHYSSRIADRIGTRLVTAAGMAFMAAGLIGFARLGQGTALIWVEAWLAVTGIGLGLNTGPVMAVVVGQVPQERAGTASGLANTARLLGATLGVAILGTLFAAHGPAGGMAAGFLDGMAAALAVGGGVMLLGAAAALATIPGQPPGRDWRAARGAAPSHHPDHHPS